MARVAAGFYTESRPIVRVRARTLAELASAAHRARPADVDRDRNGRGTKLLGQAAHEPIEKVCQFSAQRVRCGGSARHELLQKTEIYPALAPMAWRAPCLLWLKCTASPVVWLESGQTAPSDSLH
jgi:hypothetical protein